MGKTVYIFSSFNFEYDEFTSNCCLIRKKWFDKSKYIRECFKYASEILMYDFSDLLCNSSTKQNSFLNAQITYFVFSYAMYEHLSKTYKLKPEYFIGFGVGEVAALCASGVISFKEGLIYVKQTSNAINIYHNKYRFINVILTGLTISEINKILSNYKDEKDSIKICGNSFYDEIALSGKFNEIIEFLKHLKNYKFIKYLYYNYCDNEDYNKFLKNIKKAANQVTYNEIKSTVLYSSKNRLYNNNDDINSALFELFCSPININDCIMNLDDKNIDCCIEVSPDNKLKNTVKNLIPNITCFSVLNDKNELIDYMTYKKSNILTIPEICISIACTTKNNNYNSEEYRKGVIEPYLKLKKFSDKNIRNKNIANQSLHLLSTILKTKGLSKLEIDNLINDIISKSDYKDLGFNYVDKV